MLGIFHLNAYNLYFFILLNIWYSFLRYSPHNTIYLYRFTSFIVGRPQGGRNMYKKNYRKFAVSSMAATAAVAAVAPVASAADSIEYTDVKPGDTHYEGIMALSEQGVIQGYPDGSFGVYDNVTRQQVAVMLTKALELETPADVGSVLDVYSDVNADSLYADSIAAVTEAGIFTGNNGEFNPGDDITREQMTTVLVLGLDLADYNTEENVQVNLSNVSPSHDARVQILANLELTNQLDDFRPTEEISRGAFSTMLNNTLTVVGPVVVKSVSAKTTLVDDNTAGQFVEFSINGRTQAADLAALEEAGYTVEFQSTNNIFAELDASGNITGTSITSATGQLQDSLTAGNTYEYKVVVSDQNGDVVAESGLVNLKVEDLNSQYVSIDSYTLSAGGLTLENSTTALVGEKVAISSVTGTTKAGEKEKSISSYSVESSNPAVAYVSAQGELTTLKAGTTTVTITAGETTKTFTLTVSADEARTASSVTVDPAATKLVADDASMVKEVALEVTDQFGEAYSGDVHVELPTTTVDNTDVNIVDFASTSTSTVAITDGTGSFSVTGSAEGNGSVVVKDQQDGTALASVAVDVTADTEVATRSLEIVGGESDDLTIDSYAVGAGDKVVNDSTVSLALNQYNEAGFYIGKESITKGAQTAGAYTVQVSNEIGATVNVNENNEVVVTAGEEAGTVEVVISYGATELTRKTITVNNSTPQIEAVNFKSVGTITEADTKISASTVLSVNEDGLVSGVDISTNEEVYYSNNMLYVEKDGNAGLSSADLVVGSLDWIADSGLSITADAEYTTKAGDQGNIIFTVEDAADKDVNNTAVAVDVPESN